MRLEFVRMSTQIDSEAILEKAGRAEGASGQPAAASPSADPGDSSASSPETPASTPSPVVPIQGNVKRILNVKVPVIVRLAHRSMRVKEVMQFATGSIIEFDRPADAELDLMINNQIVGYGHAVKVGENFGLRVLHILSMHEKIQALGGAAE